VDELKLKKINGKQLVRANSLIHAIHPSIWSFVWLLRKLIHRVIVVYFFRCLFGQNFLRNFMTHKDIFIIPQIPVQPVSCWSSAVFSILISAWSTCCNDVDRYWSAAGCLLMTSPAAEQSIRHAMGPRTRNRELNRSWFLSWPPTQLSVPYGRGQLSRLLSNK
jgi:hypothetical protein